MIDQGPQQIPLFAQRLLSPFLLGIRAGQILISALENLGLTLAALGGRLQAIRVLLNRTPSQLLLLVSADVFEDQSHERHEVGDDFQKVGDVEMVIEQGRRTENHVRLGGHLGNDAEQ